MVSYFWSAVILAAPYAMEDIPGFFLENVLSFELKGKGFCRSCDLFLLSPLCTDTVQEQVCVFSTICWMEGDHYA